MNVNQSARCDSQQPVHTASWTVPRNLKEGIGSLFTRVNSMGQRPYCSSRMEVRYHT